MAVVIIKGFLLVKQLCQIICVHLINNLIWLSVHTKSNSDLYTEIVNIYMSGA